MYIYNTIIYSFPQSIILLSVIFFRFRNKNVRSRIIS